MTSICIVYEDRADAEIATYLADRVLADSVSWLELEPNQNLLTLPDSMCDFDWLLGSFGPQPIEASQEFG